MIQKNILIEMDYSTFKELVTFAFTYMWLSLFFNTEIKTGFKKLFNNIKNSKKDKVGFK